MSARPAFPHSSYANLSSPWRGQGWLLVLLILCGAVLLLPMLALVATAFGARHDLMGHLIETVLLRYLGNTFLLMLGVGALALAVGVSCAWVVSRYEFPYRRVLAWMLLLPLAMPSYIIAYVYTGFLDYGGPVQTALRAHYGFSDWNDYWFPEIRSMGGAVFVMGFVLYPYVYLLARTGFGQIPTRIFEATMLTGRSLFWHVGLPIGRSAILAGCALVLMEVVADFGTVDFFAVETISLGVYNVWLGMNNITAAAQLALIAVAMVALLLGSERYGRRRIGFTINNRGVTGVPRMAVLGWWRWLLPLFCLVPIIVGFFLPLVILLDFSLAKGTAHLPDIYTAAAETLLIAGLGVLVVLTSAVLVGVLAYYVPSGFGRVLARISALGYAFPGTVLALGVLAAVSHLDALWRWFGLALFGAEWGSWIASGWLMVLFAYLVRFQAVGLGAVQTALERIPNSLVPASRVMGYGFMASMRRVVLPLMRPGVLAGGLLVFVDIMKELPMTLLLRPFDFNTLATITYQYAHDELIELAALPALLIVLTGLLPVFIIQHYLNLRH